MSGVNVLNVLRRYRAVDAQIAAETLEDLLEVFSRLLASHADYTESQARGWPEGGEYPDHAWSKEIEDEARQALARIGESA